MVLLLFWIKIAIRRIIQLLKTSPLPVIMMVIFIGAVIYSIKNIYIKITLDIQTIVIVISFLMIFSLLCTFKNFNLLPVFLRFSKSKYSNKFIFFDNV